jgi:hypothetical protein
MSGVLDRMVQRSRGNLPTIEPLVRAQQTAAAAQPFVVEENAVAASRSRDVASAGQQRAFRDEPAAAVQNDGRRDATQARDATRKDSRRSDALEDARTTGTSDSGGTPAAKDADDDGSKTARLEGAVVLKEVAQEGAAPNESSIEMRAEKMSAKIEETAGESIRTRAKAEQRAATLDTPAVRNESGDAASATEAAEHTEIHITIGSVELRAPRVAPAPPKAPAFRPRVTLDEFLKRGGGSGGWGAKS